MAGEQMLEMIQSAARQAMAGQVAADLLYGTVTGTSPLKVRIDGGFEVGESFLMLSALAKPFVTTVFSHRHNAPDGPTDERLQSVQVWRGLQSGDRVRLLRAAGGQTFYVLDREGDLSS